MKGFSLVWMLPLLLSCSVPAGAAPAAAEDTTKTLASWNAKIRETPDDPMLYYRKAQCQMKLSRYAEGYATAQEAMRRFAAADSSLAWMLLESIELAGLRVDAHFNMGPAERNPPALGIVKPLSFRVWTKDGAGLLGIIDFEIGRMDGKPSTAALAQQSGSVHGVLEMLPPDAGYPVIRRMAVEAAEKAFSAPPPPPSDKP